MDRRTFISVTLGLLAAPLAAEAQPAGKVYRIGMLERTPPATNAANFEAFRRGLRELGYVEGKNLVIEYRSADGRDERFAGLATELVRLNVDLILTRGRRRPWRPRMLRERFRSSLRGLPILLGRESSRASPARVEISPG